MAAIVALVVGVYYFNFIHSPTTVPTNLRKSPAAVEPTEATVTDEQIAHLEAQLKDSDPDKRFIAICSLNALAQDNPQRLGPILVKALANKDPKVRFFAVAQLGTSKYAPAAGELTALLDDEDKIVITEAEMSLVKLGEDGLQAVMEGLTGARLKNIDGALAVAGQITGQSFGQGPEGRVAALKFWATYSPKALEKNN